MEIETLYNILLSDKPSVKLKNHEDELFCLIPELKKCKGFLQNNDWHIYDVYEHILHVIDNVSPNLIMRLSALFHDIGKPNSYKEDENKVGHFYGHWELSKEIFIKYSSKFNLDIKDSNRISDLIYYHDVSISKLDDNRLNELIEKLDVDGIEQLYDLKKADLLAQNKKYHYILNEYEIEKQKLLQETFDKLEKRN